MTKIKMYLYKIKKILTHSIFTFFIINFNKHLQSADRRDKNDYNHFENVQYK